MIDILSSTLVTAGYTWKARTCVPRVGWPGAFTAAVRAGTRDSASQVVLSADLANVAWPPATSHNTARPPEGRDTRAAHKRRRPARHPVVQAYRVWSKRRQISRRHAVRLQVESHMEEVAPAPLEEVFLMEEILPAPLQEFETGPRVHTKTENSPLLLDANQSALTCNAGCGHLDHPSRHLCQPRMSAFCRGSNTSGHVCRTPNPWRYVDDPLQSLDACATPSPFRWQLEAPEPVFELGAPAPSLSTSALADQIGEISLVLLSSGQSSSSLTSPELGGDDVFLVGGAEHEGVRGPSFVEYAPVPGAFVDRGEDSGDEVEFIL